MRAPGETNRSHSRGSTLTLAALVLAVVSAVGIGAVALARSSTDRVPVERDSDRGSVNDPAPSGSPIEEPARGNDDADRSRSYRGEARCQPIDDMNDPSDGAIPSPEELLPDPEKCPEFFQGRPGPPGAAPPSVVGIPEPTPSAPPREEPYRPCSETASLNGFPCWNTPDGPVYTDPDPLN